MIKKYLNTSMKIIILTDSIQLVKEFIMNNTELKNQNRKLKAKLTFMQVATTVFVAVLTYIYVRK
jgi:cytochrome c